MKIIKNLMQFAVNTFFNVYFKIFGEPKFSKNLQKTIELYKEDGFGKLFSLIRSWDAPYEVLEKSVDRKAVVLDLGSGDGLLSNYLAISSPQRKMFGIELNSNRVKDSFKGLKNTKFVKGSVITYKYPKADTVILAHVLHHLPSKKAQEKVLEKISKHLKKNNRLVILEIDNRPILKYIFSYLTDAITVPILFEGKLFSNNFYYRTKNEWVSILKNLGFSVSVKHVHKGMPFSHVLIEADKK